MARLGRAWHGMARLGRARHGKARQGKARTVFGAGKLGKA